MRKTLLIAAGVVMVGGGVAWAQMPPGGPDGGPPHGGMERWHGGFRRPDDGAAFFRFRRGDADITIKCPATENVQACVGAAGTLMDKVASFGAPKTQ